MRTVRVISLHQPYAAMVFARFPDGRLVKPDETRHWSTDVRGRFLIHAAQKKMGKVEENAVRGYMDLRGVPVEFVYGALLGSVELEDCKPMEVVREIRTEEDQEWGDYGDERFAWMLSNPVAFASPIDCVGRQGWFRATMPSLRAGGVAKAHLDMLAPFTRDDEKTQEKLNFFR